MIDWFDFILSDPKRLEVSIEGQQGGSRKRFWNRGEKEYPSLPVSDAGFESFLVIESIKRIDSTTRDRDEGPTVYLQLVCSPGAKVL